MAEEDPEIALLHQLQAGQEGVAWGVDGANGESEQPSITEDNEKDKKETVADDQVQSALSRSGSGVPADDGGDPSSVTLIPAVTIAGEEVSRSSSRASARPTKPRVVGGFIADDSDEEDTSESTPTSGLKLASSNTNNRTLSPSPLASAVTPQELQSVTNNGTIVAVPASALSVISSTAGTNPPVQVTTAPAVSKARLPHDTMGILEDRIKDDPKGDTEAWLSLVTEYRNRHKLDEARATYEKFLKVFPQAGEIWVAYAEMEIESDNFSAAETIFSRSLLTVPNVRLWSVYMNYIRRVNDLTNDATGNARTTVSQAYEFVLNNIGMDRDSGPIWNEYIQFLKGIPGQLGGSSWQDQQKMDILRKAYQKAICVPMSTVSSLWRDYDAFEMTLNKMTGRKTIQEKSPSYMSARSANTALDNITRGLIRTTIPKLAPEPGFEGEQEYMQQVELWKKWIAWEKEDPLDLKRDELETHAAFKKRVLYHYKQALLALRFWPEMWVEASDWCFANGLNKDGEDLLIEGISANPESCLLAFKKADRLETTLSTEEADKGPAERGTIVRAPYDKVLESLYDLVKQLKVREAKDMVKVEEESAADAAISAIIAKAIDEEDQDPDKEMRDARKVKKQEEVRQNYVSQTQVLSRTISFVWIALMRAMRRIQGKGAVKTPIGGSRQIFADARARGKITSDVYVASALIEHHVYKDAAGTKIFERGAKLFPEDSVFILEYLKHLLSIGDSTNARVTFETAVSRLTAKPELLPKAKPLYSYFHKYESQYGELSQIRKLEQRMAELFPEDPQLLHFADRYTGEGFDPTSIRPTISTAFQRKPKNPVIQSIEPILSIQNSPRPVYNASPRPAYIQTTNSPKRPFPEEFENDLNRPRKLARGESPLKGAAGRRLNETKNARATPQWQSNLPAPFVVPRDITFLLSVIPRAEFYTSTRFSPEAIVRLLSQTHIPDFHTWKANREQPQQQQQRYDGYSYGR